MSMAEDIQAAVKSDKATIGYRESIKSLKTGEARMVIIADNIPESMSEEMKRNAKAAGISLEVFDGSSRDLGTACGKPFPVAAMVIKGQQDMAGATFDTDTLRLMTLFENMTHAAPKDCIVDENCVYFVVQEGKAGAAIGKNGSNVKHVEAVIKKDVRIFEFSDDLETFVRNMIPQANEVSVKADGEAKVVEIRVDRGSKAMVIGRDGKNIKLFKELLQRSHNVDGLVVR